MVEEHATKAGFEVKPGQPLRLHYATTLDIWAAALEARKDEAIAIQSARGLRPVHEVPDRLRRPVPRGLHRRLPVHPRQELGGADGDRLDYAPGSSSDTKVLASATSISEELGNNSAIRLPSDGLKHRSP